MFLEFTNGKKNRRNKDGDNGRLYLEHHLDNFVLGGVLAEDAEDVADITAWDLPRALPHKLFFSQNNESLLYYSILKFLKNSVHSNVYLQCSVDFTGLL
jgi:hypothetical protein